MNHQIVILIKAIVQKNYKKINPINNKMIPKKLIIIKLFFNEKNQLMAK